MKQSQLNNNQSNKNNVIKTTNMQSLAPNSALMFVAQNSEVPHLTAQQIQEKSNVFGAGPQTRASINNNEEGQNGDHQGPVGLTALCAACSRLYPDQLNPLQVTARIKYWLGGPDPLDYISMYWNPGRPEADIPPHWHYVSFGLSDLHGDGRVHPPPDRVVLAARASRAGAESDGLEEVLSGLGLEMTFRLRSEPRLPPPTWPAALLQNLARYIFRTGNRVCVGDHVSWHSALDGSRGGRVRHMLVALDHQLGLVETPLGRVQFVQSYPSGTAGSGHWHVKAAPVTRWRFRFHIVGATGRELRAAQRRTGAFVLDLMAAEPGCGGAWHVTDMSRVRSAAGVLGRPSVAPGGAGEGSHETEPPSELAGVSTVCRWCEWVPVSESQIGNQALPSDAGDGTVEDQIRWELQRGLTELGGAPRRPCVETRLEETARGVACKMSTDSLKMDRYGNISTESLKMVFGSTEGFVRASTDSFCMSSVEEALLGTCDANRAVVKSEPRADASGAVLKRSTRSMEEMEGAGSPGEGSETVAGLDAVTLRGVHLMFNAEGGSLLPLALRGRVLHGRHFTWRCAGGAQAVTLLSAAVSGALASAVQPYVATGHGWLQVLLPDELARDMAARLDSLSGVADSVSDLEEEQAPADPVTLPATFEWPSSRIKITVLHDAGGIY